MRVLWPGWVELQPCALVSVEDRQQCFQLPRPEVAVAEPLPENPEPIVRTCRRHLVASDGELVRSAVMEMTPRSTRQPFSDLAPSRPPSPHQHRYVPVTRSGQTHLLRSRGCKHLLLCLSPCGGAEPNKFQWFLLSELCLLLLASEGNSARCHVLTLTAAGPTALGQATMPAASEPTSGATSQMTQEPCLACPSSAT